MTPTKLQWLSAHLDRPIVIPESGPIDCLSEKDREQFNIVSTDNVSDHPYNPTALRMIAEMAAADGMVLDCGAGIASSLLKTSSRLRSSDIRTSTCLPSTKTCRSKMNHSML
jgi:hypothetical protein